LHSQELPLNNDNSFNNKTTQTNLGIGVKPARTLKIFLPQIIYKIQIFEFQIGNYRNASIKRPGL